MSIATEAGRAFAAGRAERENHVRAPRQPVLAVLAGIAGRHMPRWRRMRTGINQTAAFAAIDFAVWHQWGMTVGLIASAVSLLVLDALAGENGSRR